MDLLKKASPADDDIIDLTDIIEQGPVASSAKHNAEQEMDAQMDTLFSKGNKEAQQLLPSGMDDDIDALLAEMEDGAGGDSSGPTAAAPKAAPVASKSAAPALNADETLDMPNMSEVDALLEGLDIPPQPSDTSATSIPDALSDDLDSMLGDMLTGTSKSAPATMTPDDLDALLAKASAEINPASAAPAPSAPASGADALPIDLDALLAEASAEIDTAPAAPAPSAPASDADALSIDLDALLAEASAEIDTAPAAPAPPAPASDADALSIDLDALLAEASAEIDTAPAAPKAPTPAAPASTGMELDELDALLAESGATSAPTDPAPTDTKAAASPSLDDDIDALLLAESAPQAEAPRADPAKNNSSFDADLDSLLAAAAAPTPVGKAGRTTSAAAIPSLEDDLDALFATVSPKSAAGASHSPDPAPQNPASDADQDMEDDTPIDLSDMDDTDTNSPDDAEKLADIVVPTKGVTGAKAASSPIDDLLAGLDLDTSPTPSSATPSAALEDIPTKTSTDTFDEIAALMADASGQDLKGQDVGGQSMPEAMDIAMVSMADMTDMPAMPATSPKGEKDLPELDALDALLQAANNAAPDADNLSALSTVMPDLELASDSSLTDEEAEVAFTDEEISQAAQELYDEKIMAEATTGDVDTSAWMDSLNEALIDAEATEGAGGPAVQPPPTAATESPDRVTEPDNIDQLLAHLPEDLENTHYVYRPNAGEESVSTTSAQSRRVRERTNTTANPPFEKAYEQELARLQHITDRFAQSLAAADMHIAALTNTTTNAVPPLRNLDDILSQDSPFNASLQTLVRNAVASELKTGVPAKGHAGSPAQASASPAVRTGVEGIDALAQRLDSLNTQMQSLHERINALEDGNKEARLQTVETRVDGQVKTIIHLEERYKILEAHLEAQAKSQNNLENRFQYEVEKAAAAAAAKIIREEIAGILAGN